MDPDANLIELVELVRCIEQAADSADDTYPIEHRYKMDTGREMADDAARAAELFRSLNDWVTAGGFLPAPWQKAQQAAKRRGEQQMHDDHEQARIARGEL